MRQATTIFLLFIETALAVCAIGGLAVLAGLGILYFRKRRSRQHRGAAFLARNHGHDD